MDQGAGIASCTGEIWVGEVVLSIHQQLNCSNTILNTMTKHLTIIETQTLTEKPSTSNSPKPPKKPIYKLINVLQKDLEVINFTNIVDKKFLLLFY